MPDFTKFSDQELTTFIQQRRGRQAAPTAPPAASQVISKDPIFQNIAFTPPRQARSKSPGTLMERFIIGLSDDPERELRERFPFVQQLPNGKFSVGNRPNQLLPFDPEGFLLTDLPGDFMDVMGEAFPIVGQVMGGLGGAAAGTAGAPGAGTIAGLIGGSAVGAALGEAIKQDIGVMLGVNERKADEILRESLISGVFGGVASTLPVAGGAIARGMAASTRSGLLRPVAEKSAIAFGKVLDSIQKRNPFVAQKLERVLPQIMNFTSGRDPRAVKIVLQRGAKETLSSSNMNPNKALLIASRVQRDILTQKDKFGTAVREATSEITKATRNRRIVNVDKSYQELVSDLKNIGFLGNGNVVNPHFVSEGNDKAVFTSLLNQISRPRFIKKPKLGRFNEVVGKQQLKAFIRPEQQMTVEESLIIREQFSNAFEKLSKRGQFIMTRFLRGQNGINTQIAQIAENVGARGFATANAQFSEFMEILQQLELGGIKIENREVLTSLASDFFKRSPNIRSLILRLDPMLPTKVVPQMDMFSAAQNFLPGPIDVLRTGFLMSFIGVSLGNSLPEKLGMLGAAFLVASPQGARIMLRSREGGLGAAREAVSRAMQRVQRASRRAGQLNPRQQRAAEAVLGRLLRGREPINPSILEAQPSLPPAVPTLETTGITP